jgi:hypothetical protein
MSRNDRVYDEPQASSLIHPLHIHEPVNFNEPLKESQHDIEELTEELNYILNLRDNQGNRRLTANQRSTLLEYQTKQGVYKKLLDPDFPDDDKAYRYSNLFNVLILQDKLRGRLAFDFSKETNEQKCSELVIEHGYATMTIWSQAFITRSERRLRQLQQIVLVEMINAFFRIYGCTRCWLDHPNWQEEGLYGKTDLYYSIEEAIEDDAYLALKKFP